MAFEDELEEMEAGCETEAEQIDEETEIEDVESQLDDDYMDPNAMTSDLEQAYEGFMENHGRRGVRIDEDGPDLMEEAIRDETGMYLGENGYHVVDPYGDDDSEADLPSNGNLDDFDAEELADEAEEVDELEPWTTTRTTSCATSRTRPATTSASCFWRTARRSSTSTPRRTRTPMRPTS